MKLIKVSADDYKNLQQNDERNLSKNIFLQTNGTGKVFIDNSFRTDVHSKIVINHPVAA